MSIVTVLSPVGCGLPFGHHHLDFLAGSDLMGVECLLGVVLARRVVLGLSGGVMGGVRPEG